MQENQVVLADEVATEDTPRCRRFHDVKDESSGRRSFPTSSGNEHVLHAGRVLGAAATGKEQMDYIVMDRTRSRLESHQQILPDALGNCKAAASGVPRPNDKRSIARQPILISVEALVADPTSSDSCQRVRYRAHFEFTNGDHTHRWRTEAFTLDDLLAVVVSTRVALAKRACSTRKSHRSQDGEHLSTRSSSWHDLGRRVQRILVCFMRWIASWMMLLWLGWRLTWAVCPVSRQLLSWLPELPQAVESWIAELLLSGAIALLGMSLTGGLVAGLAEMAFFPAKVVLQLERKDETAQVKEHLSMLLTQDNLSNLNVCNFLNFGMATYYGSSETQKEGRCLCRLHESSEVYFAFSRKGRWRLPCCTCEIRGCARRWKT
mmetsp:Transcript_44141/g.80594  ORF Transcript_44141/g.80594 Transcript_44141/m.80594 type:complete len:377 (+) Transcript_44141:62-1192(+)